MGDQDVRKRDTKEGVPMDPVLFKGFPAGARKPAQLARLLHQDKELELFCGLA